MNKKLYDLIAGNMSLLYMDYAYESHMTLENYFRQTIIKDRLKCHKKLKALYKNHLRKNQLYFNSFDQINMMFEQFYSDVKFSQYRFQNELCIEHLFRLASSFLTYVDSKFILKYWIAKSTEDVLAGFSGLEKVELWNSFSRIFSSDLLVAAYLLHNKMDNTLYMKNFNWTIYITDQQLEKILNKGVSENHIHINAGYNFSMLWEQLMDSKESKVQNDMYRKIDDDLVTKIKMARFTRYVLRYSLLNSKNAKESLDSFIGNSSEISMKKVMKSIIEEVSRGTITKAFIDFDSESSIENLITNSPKFDKSLDEEKYFIFDALKYVQHTNDKGFINLFWQYIRIKNNLLSAITQFNSYEGLDYFTEEYYGKVSVVEDIKVNDIYKKIKSQIQHNTLSKIEIRVSPGSKRKDIIKKVRDFLEAYKKLLKDVDIEEKKMPVIGLVFHLIKKKDDNPLEKCFKMESENDDGLDLGAYLSYGKNTNEYLKIVENIKGVRAKYKNISYYIVGLDTASKENDTEPWVFSSVFHNMRDSRVSEVLMRDNRVHHMKTIGFTYHVGEDYRHVISGLRHIDEVIKYFGYHAGDRIGHGISLAIDLKDWIKNNPVVYMPRIEYLENLLWMWHRLGNVSLNTKGSSNHSIETKALQIAKEIYISSSGLSMLSLWEAYQKKFQKFVPEIKTMEEFCRAEYNYKSVECMLTTSQIKNTTWNEVKLLYAYHCKKYLVKMNEVIPVKVSIEEFEMFKLLQDNVRKELSFSGIIVETNPSSNLSISGMDRLYKHTAASLNKYGLDSNATIEDSLIMTINSDDPIIFNSTVSNEIGYVFYMLQYQGYSRDAILSWIEKVRNWGLESSFVDQRKLTNKERLNEIQEILDSLEQF